jgi:hypothetical protein
MGIDTTMETSELELVNTFLFPASETKQAQKQTILQLFRVWSYSFLRSSKTLI